MGKILGSKRNKDKIVFEVELSYEEAVALKGHYDNVHIFSENGTEHKTSISARGKNAATKYFLIPTRLRTNKISREDEVCCQKIDSGTRTIYVYVVDNEPYKTGV